MPAGKLLMVAGFLLVAIGYYLTLGGRLPLPGRLPGDLHFEHNGFSVYLPLGTSLLASLVLSLLYWLLRK